jgi:hypothetical protein
LAKSAHGVVLVGEGLTDAVLDGIEAFAVPVGAGYPLLFAW